MQHTSLLAPETAGLMTDLATQTDFIRIDQQASNKRLAVFDQLQSNL